MKFFFEIFELFFLKYKLQLWPAAPRPTFFLKLSRGCGRSLMFWPFTTDSGMKRIFFCIICRDLEKKLKFLNFFLLQNTSYSYGRGRPAADFNKKKSSRGRCPLPMFWPFTTDSGIKRIFFVLFAEILKKNLNFFFTKYKLQLWPRPPRGRLFFYKVIPRPWPVADVLAVHHWLEYCPGISSEDLW